MGAASKGYWFRQFYSPTEIQNFSTHLASNLHKEMELPGENTWVNCLGSHSAVVMESPPETGVPEGQMNSWGGPREDEVLFTKKTSPQKVMQMAQQLDCGYDLHSSIKSAMCQAL